MRHIVVALDLISQIHSRAPTTDLQIAGDALKRAAPKIANGFAVMVNFPLFWKMCLDMVKAGSGYELDYEILVPGTDLRTRASVTDIVEVEMLPKAIGGEAVFMTVDGNEDETCTIGIVWKTLSEYLGDLE